MIKNNDMLKEQIPHGDVLFPLMVHEVTTNLEFEERVNCHWHREMEFLVVTEGQAQVHIDDKSCLMKQNGIIVIPSNHLHSITSIKGVSFSFFAVVFDPSLLSSFINDGIQQKYMDCVLQEKISFTEFIVPTEKWAKNLLCMLLDIRSVFEKKDLAYELIIKSKLYTIWYLLYTNAVAKEQTVSKNADYKINLIKSMIFYIKEHFDSHISLTEMAENFHLSEGHLCRFFKSMTKMTVMEYCNYYRISVGAAMLSNTDKSIGEIAGMTGFNNISYFNKVFLEYMHMTPSAFRHKEI